MDQLNILFTFVFISVIATAVWAPLLIDLLYKMNIVVRHVLTRNKMNEEFVKIHGHKSGTPTMGGLMISVTVGVLIFLCTPSTTLRGVFLLFWTLFTLYGLFEGLMVFARKVDEKFKLLQETFSWRLGKLFILFVLTTGAVAFANQYLGVNTLNLLPFWQITLNPLWVIFLGLCMGLAIYGMEITDGADGLVTGQFLMAILVYLVIVLNTNHSELMPYLAFMLGSSLVYLYFNINPARVFMGGTGTLPIGFALFYFALLTNTLFPFFIMGIVFWVELFSSMSQIIAIRFFKRKIFRIAPIHHHFEAIGWPEAKVVQRFWLASAVFGLLALWLWSLA